jgi:zinc transporter
MTNTSPEISGAINKKNIQTVFIRSTGGAEIIAVDQISEALKRDDGFLWVNVHCATPQKTIGLVPGIPKYIEKSLSANETRPRAEILPEGLLLNLRCLNPNAGHEPANMVSLRFWISEKAIISVHRKPLDFVDNLFTHLSEKTLVSNSIDILRLLLESIIEKMSNRALDINEAMEGLEDSPETIHQKRRHLSEYRREIISIRRYLIPQREALLRLPLDKLIWINEMDKISLREASDSTARILEDLESLRDRANLLQEEFMNTTQEQINKKIFLLSIVAVIFMPLSFITGLLGVNVGGIPGSAVPSAFWIVCIILFAIVAIEVCILKYLKWL